MKISLLELKDKFPAASEYLSQILFIHRDYGTVSNARLAARLNVSRPAVTQAVGRLKKLGLVEQDRYGSIGLSPEGKEIAEAVIRRHYLLEHLLVGDLGFPWDKSDDEAGRLQDMISDELTEHLFVRLGKPDTCPHGNPFPGTEAEVRYLKAEALENQEPGSKVLILRITEEGELTEGMLGFCEKHTIKPGTKLEVYGVDEETVDVKTEGRNVSIPREYAALIRVETL